MAQDWEFPGRSGWQPRVLILRPLSLDGAEQAVQALLQEQIVVLNLDALEAPEAQRLVDFVAGAVLALDGQLQRVDDLLLLAAPVMVHIRHIGGSDAVEPHGQDRDRGDPGRG